MKKTRQVVRSRVSSLLSSLTRAPTQKVPVQLPPTRSSSLATTLCKDDLHERIDQLTSQVAALSAENDRLRDAEARLKEALAHSRVPDAVEDDVEIERSPSPDIEITVEPEPPVRPRLRKKPTLQSIKTMSIIRSSRISDLLPVSEESDDEDVLPAGIIEEETSSATAVDHLRPPSVVVDVPVADLSGCIERKMDYPLYGGAYADVHVAVLKVDGEEKDVAVKVIRAHTYDEVDKWKIDKRLRREVRVWSCLKHPNVVPLLGTTLDFGLYMSMVCPWMEDGDLNHYLKDHRATLTLSTRLQLIADVAEGLCYLHSRSIVHGDLTTANILINKGVALISDFGLSSILSLRDRSSFISSTVGGAVRWAAPELYRMGIDSSELHPELSKPCDIYSFGNVMLHTISGQIPYANIASDVQVMFQLMKGNHPWRPPEPCLTDKFWHLMTLCWKHAYERPDAKSVRERLRVVSESCSEEMLRSRLELDVDGEGETQVDSDWAQSNCDVVLE